MKTQSIRTNLKVFSLCYFHNTANVQLVVQFCPFLLSKIWYSFLRGSCTPNPQFGVRGTGVVFFTMPLERKPSG
jgi:hypothetical protein